MIRLFLKYINPVSISNFILKFYINFKYRFLKYSSPSNFWNDNLVDHPKGGYKSVSQSINHLNWRNNQYLNSIENMNFKNTHKKVVIDYGCGPGNDLINILKDYTPKKLIGIDVSKKAISVAKERCKIHSFNVEFMEISEEKPLKIINQSIDVIKSNGVLHHLDNLSFILKEFQRVLKKDGIVNLMIYNRNSIWFHLHVAYELKIKKKIFSKWTDEEVFKISTDGFNCPISRCYTPETFRNICNDNKFKCKFINSSISLFEMKKLNMIWEALKSQKLSNDSRDFLNSLTFDNKGIPKYKGQVAGINAYYELRKF